MYPLAKYTDDARLRKNTKMMRYLRNILKVAEK